MDKERAIQVLDALANGIDPRSGDILPAHGVYDEGEIIRALCFAVTVLKNNAGNKWTMQEEERLRLGFEEGMAIEKLATAHKRSPGAIKLRLMLMGLIERTVTD